MKLENLLNRVKEIFNEVYSGETITHLIEDNYIYIYIYIYIYNDYFNLNGTFRLQFDSLVTFYGLSICIHNLEKKFRPLISNGLKSKYKGGGAVVFNVKEFYKSTYNFSQDIKSDEQLEEFLLEVKKNVEFHKKEVFPKLLDPKYLAEYVGVPFERRDEVVVGGSFPLQFFKKMAILKWGGQEKRYQEYKEETNKLIDKYAIKKPEKYNSLFRENFESLVNHLEKGSNGLSL